MVLDEETLARIEAAVTYRCTDPACTVGTEQGDGVRPVSLCTACVSNMLVGLKAVEPLIREVRQLRVERTYGAIPA
jgi:hypothetical protein